MGTRHLLRYEALLVNVGQACLQQPIRIHEAFESSRFVAEERAQQPDELGLFGRDAQRIRRFPLLFDERLKCIFGRDVAVGPMRRPLACPTLARLRVSSPGLWRSGGAE